MTDDANSTTPSAGQEKPETEQPKAEAVPPAAAAPAQDGSQHPVEEKTIEVNKSENDGSKSHHTVFDPNKLGILSDVSIVLTIEVGRAQIKIRDLLGLSKGSIVELNKSAGDPVDIYANGKLISTGSIITANGKYCVRLTSIPENSKIGLDQHGQ